MGYALGCTSHEMLWLAVMGIGGAGGEETAGMAGVPPSTELLAPERRAQLLRRGLWLEYATLGWNVVEIGFLVAAAVTLISGVEPDSSALGIGWLAATCVVMFGLAAGKARTGDALGHPVLRAEAGVTVVDGALAAGILAGLVLNAVAGWWWADVAAGAILVVYGIREGRDHLWASH
jgi:hypothetical protein